MLTGINSGAIATYSYDAWRRRISRVVGGNTVTKYVPDGTGQILSEYGVTDGWQRDYIYLNGQLVARVSSAANEGVLYVVNDHLGTPVAMVDSAKTVRWRARWYPFGEIYSEQVSAGNDVRFPGQLRDDESGLYYNWHRYYSPELGRYYQSDPIGLEGGVNQYAYAYGSPILYADPEGLYSSEKLGYELAYLLVAIGDDVSGGLTSWIRSTSLYGGDCFTNKNSVGYALGQLVGEFALYILSQGTSSGGPISWNSFASDALLSGLALNDKISLVGQNHHGVSKAIHDELELHRNLKGIYKSRDPRLVTKAANLKAHVGYQDWHIQLDQQVVDWLRKHPKATQRTFERYLRKIYSTVAMLKRFPRGL